MDARVCHMVPQSICLHRTIKAISAPARMILPAVKSREGVNILNRRFIERLPGLKR